MLRLVEQLSGGLKTRDEARRITKARSKPKRGRPKNYVFKYAPAGNSVRLSLQFRKAEASKDEVIAALEKVLEDLKGSGS
jgi:hypothetical protein